MKWYFAVLTAVSALGCVDAVVVRFHQLNFGTLLTNLGFYGSGAFVVQNVEFRFATALFQIIVNFIETFDHRGVVPAAQRAHEYRVLVVDIRNKNILLPRVGHDRETPRLVGIYCALVGIGERGVAKHLVFVRCAYFLRWVHVCKLESRVLHFIALTSC